MSASPLPTRSLSAADFCASPNALASHYRRFRVAERLLLTGHSHQAWPDRAITGQVRAFEDAADLVDAKWEKAFAEAEKVKAGFARLLDDASGTYALGASTHDLLIRFLSALPLVARPKLVTTDGEFHSIRRQLDRLSETGVEVVKVTAEAPALAERLIRQIDDRTAAVLVSSVLFQSSRIVRGLDEVLETARRHGSELVVDTYHALNVVPSGLAEHRLNDAFVLGGGYKYCQLGEGNCFLRVPPGRDMRPVVTGWYAEFELLEATAESQRVAYGSGAAAFMGSTYDPTSHYRAAEVFQHFAELELTPEFLRRVSQHQIGVLCERFDALDADPELARRDIRMPLDETGGFLVVQSRRAAEICSALRTRGVFTDSRADRLRFGPAPYLEDRQLHDAIGHLGEVLAEMASA